jgi:hypothetical protein
VAALRSQASSRAEFLLGIGLASIACSSLILFGVLSRRVHLAWHRGATPWRLRLGEFLGLGAGVGLIGGGLCCLFTLPLAGLWSTLAKVA